MAVNDDPSKCKVIYLSVVKPRGRGRKRQDTLVQKLF